MKFAKILRDNIPVWGVLEGEVVRTLKTVPYNGIEYDGKTEEFSKAKLLAPCDPTKIVCVGKNYFDHAIEIGDGVPEYPILFIKPTTSLNNPDSGIVYPPFVKRLDYECELAIVIKKTAKNIRKEDYCNFILGYTCLNDITARDIQQKDGQWTRSKSMDGFAPIGPILTDEINPNDVGVSTILNGEVKQLSRTSKFMTKIPEMMEFITAAMTLLPGDVIATGTPSGIGPMKPGDTVVIKIEGIGELKNTIVRA